MGSISSDLRSQIRGSRFCSFIMLKLLTLAVALAAVRAQNFNGGDAQWYCGILGNEDCSTHPVDEKCGTDLVTYTNGCELGKAHCKDTNINQYKDGPCSNRTYTTLSPQEVVHGSQVILDFQCAALSHRDCVNAFNEKICGTDGRTYANFCEYEKSRCTHRNLHVAHLGDCSA